MHQELLIRIALKSDVSKKHAALIESSGRVLSLACNKTICYNHFPYTLHAEEHAINMCKSNTKGATIFVLRVNSQGKLRNSKPCPECMATIKRAGIKTIYYTTNNGWEEIKL